MDHYDHLVAGARCLNRRGASATEMAQAFRLFTEAASRGSADAMEEVATMLATGRGVRHAPDAALHYYQLAIAAGSVRANAGLAALLNSPAIEDRDAESAAEFYADGAGVGDGDALYGLARMRRDGEGGRRDLTAARILFRQAARAGHWQAARELAAMHLTDGNPLEAWAWMRRAVALGGGAAIREQAERLEYGFSAAELQQAQDLLHAVAA
ncbi:MAG: hypothetical protein MUF14_10085 [Hyphomonadaceae bacterium]|jgi:hypothetical protein|nr:hypothetical protein [Hyphomonadaceae bacterium]